MQQAEVPVSTAGVRAPMTPMRDLTRHFLIATTLVRLIYSAGCLSIHGH
jgi:hypothetical protein